MNMHRIPMSFLQLSHSGLLSEKDDLRSTQAAAEEEVKVYKLPPEEVERLLKAQYGNKLEAVNKDVAGKPNGVKKPVYYGRRDHLHS